MGYYCPWGRKELDTTERLTHYGKQYGGSPEKIKIELPYDLVVIISQYI